MLCLRKCLFLPGLSLIKRLRFIEPSFGLFSSGKYHCCFSSGSSLSLISPLVQQFLDSLKEEFYVLHTKPQTQENASSDDPRLFYLQNLLDMKRRYDELSQTIVELTEFLKEFGDDKQLSSTCEKDRQQCMEQQLQIQNEILKYIADPNPEVDHNEAYLEFSCGVGGQEAMLFTKELYKMYANYAAYRGWQFHELSCDDDTDFGGIRKAVAQVFGVGVYAALKFEGGVHRVQRVPVTDSKNRVHTSAAALAITPPCLEVSDVLDRKDLEIKYCKASSSGGQFVNTSYTAVRIKHLPTGLAAENQTERMQQANEKKAMQRLAALVYEHKMGPLRSAQNSMMKLQVLTRDRTDKIRTFNFPDDRLTDHRIKRTFPNVSGILQGGSQFDVLVKAVAEFHHQERINDQLERWSNTRKNKNAARKQKLA